MQRHISILHGTFYKRWPESREDNRQNNWWPEYSKMTFSEKPIPTSLTEKELLLTIAMDVIFEYVTFWDVNRL